MRRDDYGYFTLVVMLETALVAGVAAWRLAKLCVPGAVSIGAWTGGAAAVWVSGWVGRGCSRGIQDLPLGETLDGVGFLTALPD